MPRHDAETLKLMFPEVAFELECDQVRAELREQLGLQAYVNVDANRAIAGVTLNDGYELLITPAMPGFNGIDNWFKWRALTNPKTGETVTMSQVRCTVELLAHDTDSYMSLISFGIDAANMEQLVSKALGKIHKHCGLRLVALPRVKTNNPNK
jgi:hypothetical protein